MPIEVIDQRKSTGWVRLDRAVIRDTRLKSNHKLLYALFCSLAETNEKVFPSYSWLAREMGYVYNGKHPEGSDSRERALRDFVMQNLQPLLDLGWIRKVNNSGGSYSYVVCEHDCNPGTNPEEKTSYPRKKKLPPHPEEKTSSSNKDISSKKELDRSSSSDNQLLKFLVQEIPQLEGMPHLPEILQILETRDEVDRETYIRYVANHKKGRYLETIGWRKYFWLDFIAYKIKQQEKDEPIAEEWSPIPMHTLETMKRWGRHPYRYNGETWQQYEDELRQGQWEARLDSSFTPEKIPNQPNYV